MPAEGHGAAKSGACENFLLQRVEVEAELTTNLRKRAIAMAGIIQWYVDSLKKNHNLPRRSPWFR